MGLPATRDRSVELAAAVLDPHFSAVRDVYVESGLPKLRKTKFVVDPDLHDTPRHFAACREDGLLILLAPQAADLPVNTLIAIMAHEFGHAADFAYPGCWLIPFDGPQVCSWIGESERAKAEAWRKFGEPTKRSRVGLKNDDRRHAIDWMKAWESRDKDQIEWTADGIAEAVTGQHLTYCGDCVLQCLGGRGIERPRGLR